MRTKRGTQKLKYNSKINKIVCFRCGHLKKVLRSDTKFCSDLCRVQERNFRLENGYAKSLFEGKENELEECYGYPPSLHKVNNPLVEDLLVINDFLKTAKVDRSWKEQFPGFIVYHFPNNKLKPYQIYCTEDKFWKWKDYKEKEEVNDNLNQGKTKITHVKKKLRKDYR